MSNINKYTYSEILSFFTPCDPPKDFQSSCPVFTPESQNPVIISNFKPNPNFGGKPFNFVPKKTKSSDSSSDNMQKSVQMPKIVDFRPQIMKEEKNENLSDNSNNDSGNISNNPSYVNQPNKFRFRPETISKPTSSSAPPTAYSDFKPNAIQAKNENIKYEFKPQKEEVKKTVPQNYNQEEIKKSEDQKEPDQQDKTQEEKKLETQNEKSNKDNSNNNRFFFRPQKEEKKAEVQQNTSAEVNNLEKENKSEEQKDNNKSTPWANISVKPQKKNDDFDKVNSAQYQLQKEIDNSLISPKNNINEPLKSGPSTGFAPKKLEQAYEAPEIPTESSSKPPKQKRKVTTNFDDIEKEEKSQKNQQQPQQPQQQQKKGLFEALLEKEKQNQNINSKKETKYFDDEPPKKQPQMSTFKPKQASQFYDGPSIDEINKANNTNSNDNKNNETKSSFNALMEQEKISSEKEKKDKEITNQNIEKVKKPSIVDILIAESMKEKSMEKPKDNEEEIPVEKEEKPSQGFKPLKATASYEAPSIEEIETFSKQQQKKTTFTEAIANQKQSQNKKAKPSFEELQKKESAKQSQAKKQSSFSNAPSFFDLLVKEEKKEKESSQSTQSNDTSKETESIQKKPIGFNPKRNKPDTGSFSEMLDKEKKLQKENKSKNNTNAPVNVKVNPVAKKPGNFPSFAQLISDEARLEEQRSAPFQPTTTNTFTSNKNSSFQQKIKDEELKSDATTIGDFVYVQGELPKKWNNKKNRGRKRGGKTNDNSDFFWGTPDFNDDDDIEDDQGTQNWPPVNEVKEEPLESNFGFASNSRPTNKDNRVTWLSKVLEEELGEENPWEFAESLVNKSKPEMIRFLSTITFDQQQASNIANRFYQLFPVK